MRIAVLTDLHANREAIEAVLAHARAAGVDRYAFLGDQVGYGADPAWVVDRVREHARGDAIVVRGNHDEAVVRGVQPGMHPQARHVIEWTHQRLDAAQLEFLAGLPLRHETGELLFVHANAFNPAGWAYLAGRPEAARSMLAASQRVTFCGHMHDPRLYHLSATGKVADFVPVAGEPIPLLRPRRWTVIPGAAGQPRDGDPAACYAIYDDTAAEVTYWRVPYDIEAAGAKIRAAALPQTLAQRLADGL